MARRRPKKSLAMVNREKRLRARLQRAALTGEERTLWLARQAEYQRQRRARLAPDELALERQKNAARNRVRRAAMSQENLERLRRRNRERACRRRDGARGDLALDTAARPDLFASMGLRRRQRTEPKARTGGPEAADEEQEASDKAADEECAPVPLVSELDPIALLSSVQVELTEGHGDSELHAPRTEG